MKYVLLSMYVYYNFVKGKGARIGQQEINLCFIQKKMAVNLILEMEHKQISEQVC